MRPRHKAAEYEGYFEPDGLLQRTASMRPRHKAAEYDITRDRFNPP